MMGTLGVHETLDLHEILTFKNLCVTKSALMSKLVQDDELKQILENDAASGYQEIQQLQGLIRAGRPVL
ncbi:hypothetical protein [Mesobacillus harenae]|uniref:hypothetical protein n=1 Tax=Mesobacillus harenae TaxID=2213203 RepID=UPI001580D965|nr:hypothetical protein [Mesobacillus harenae]